MKWTKQQLESDPTPPKDRLDAILNEPCRNPRYGGMTMHEMVRKVVLRRNDKAGKREKIDLK